MSKTFDLFERNKAPVTWTPLRGLYDFSNRPELIAGSVAGYFSHDYLGEKLSPFFEYTPAFEKLLGKDAALYFHWAGILFAVVFAIIAARLVISVIEAHFPELLTKPNYVLDYVVPPPPEPDKEFQIYLGERHKADGTYVFPPTWWLLIKKSLTANVIYFANTGGGKTASFIIPVLRQSFAFKAKDPSQKIGILLVDIKGVLTTDAIPIAARIGRKADIVEISLGGYRFNPIDGSQPEATAEIFISALYARRGSSGNGDNDWYVGFVYDLFAGFIGAYYLAFGDCTLHDFNEMVTGPLRAVANQDGELPHILVQEIERFTKAFNERIELGDVREGQRGDFEYRLSFMKRFAKENPRNRSTVLDAALEMTGIFSRPDVRETFCPSKEEVDFPGVADLMESGKILCLNMGASDQKLAQFIGIVLKIHFQRHVLGRLSQGNINRFLLFICDEYQSFCTVTGPKNADGDDHFFALSRQSNAASICTAQSPVSLEARIGKPKLRVLMSSMRTKIIGPLSDPEDAKLASEWFGSRFTNVRSETFNERSKGNSRYNPISGQVDAKAKVETSVSYSEQQRALFDPFTIQNLKTFEAIVSVFDGHKSTVGKCYLKPHYKPVTMPHCKIAREMEEEAQC